MKKYYVIGKKPQKKKLYYKEKCVFKMSHTGECDVLNVTECDFSTISVLQTFIILFIALFQSVIFHVSVVLFSQHFISVPFLHSLTKCTTV